VALLADLPKCEELRLDLGRYELLRDGSVIKLEKIPMPFLHSPLALDASSTGVSSTRKGRQARNSGLVCQSGKRRIVDVESGTKTGAAISSL
jgi:hypothetical protein